MCKYFLFLFILTCSMAHCGHIEIQEKIYEKYEQVKSDDFTLAGKWYQHGILEGLKIALEIVKNDENPEELALQDSDQDYDLKNMVRKSFNYPMPFTQ